MAIKIIGIEDFNRMGIDPETGKLYWDKQEVVTTLSLPWAVNLAISAAALFASLSLA
jgi:hypothetical protein